MQYAFKFFLGKPAGWWRISLLLFLFVAGCIREIDVDLPDLPARLVVVAHFSPDTVFMIRLGLSGEGLAEPKELPEGASVRIIDEEDNIEQLNLKAAPDGWYWQNRTRPKTDSEYRIEVSVPGYPAVSGTSKAPLAAPIQPEIITERDTFAPYLLSSGAAALRKPIRITIPNPGNGYHAFNIRYERKELFDTFLSYPRAQILSDPETESHFFDISEGVWLINDELWEHQNYLDLDLFLGYQPEFSQISRIIIEWMTLSPEYYQYHLSLARQGDPTLPFNSPEKLYSNLLGGYGSFSGYNQVTYSINL
jgi:Domain of unknown function (DUF4249)